MAGPPAQGGPQRGGFFRRGRMQMAWTKPRVLEISVALEINCYACAEIG
jgi:coenzyme PQQ precursor peptide PqqA